ncbi:MAG TPA: glycosyltransferase family 4 protein, partial [Bryobacteraceae bacterium]
MPRLAYITFDRVPAPKGASTHIEAFARGLASEWSAIDLVTVGEPSPDPIERWPGVIHWELPALGPTLIDRALCFGRALSHWLAPRDFEIVQFRSIFEGLPILRNRKHAALIFEVNGLPSIELKYRYPGCEDDRELMGKIIAQERACVSAAARIVTPSAVTRDFLIRSRGANPEQIEVIPNGVDTALFRPRNPIENEGSLVYFGTLSTWQGVDLAIRAAARVNVPLKIYGTGGRGRREALERLSAKLAAQVTLHPPIAQEELAEQLSHASVILAPLVWNDRNALQGCCPLKVLEGLASGRPVISSNLEVVRQLATHEEHLLLAKPGSVDGIVDAIERL